MSSPTPSLRLRPLDYRSNEGRSVAAEHGTCSVPARRGAPGGGRVELAFVRLPATATARSGVPTVFLTGGPGLSAIRSGRGRLFALFDALRAGGDVILLDQRGSGESTPSLRCPEPLRVPLDRHLTREAMLSLAVESTRRCAGALARDGIDLAGFNTVESADDVADLAGALGYPRVSLLGWSYGSHLAMSVIRRHESLVARAVFAGPEGPDHTYKLPSRVHRQLDVVAEMARVNAGLRVHVPDLRAALGEALRRVEREPVRVRLSGDSARDAVVGRFDLEWMIAESLADTRFVRRLPAVLARMARGEFDDIGSDRVLRGAFEELRTSLFDSPLRYCMDCASGATAARWERISREADTLPLGRTIDWPFPEICEAVGRPDLGDDFRTPSRSDVPVLFITGTLDCRTPADNVADLAPAFPNARHVVAEDAGHGDLLLPGGVQRAIVRFLQDGIVEAGRVRVDGAFSFEKPRPVLLYDGACGFCRRQVERLRARAGDAVDFTPLQEGGPRFASLDAAALRRTIHLVDAEGRVFTGAEAILVAAPRSNAARCGLWAYRHVPGVRGIAEAVYRFVARHRGSLA